MKLVFVSSAFEPNPNISFIPLVANYLSRRGHVVRGVQYHSVGEVEYIPVEQLDVPIITTPHWAGRWFIYRVWPQRLKSLLEANPPDVIVADKAVLVPSIRAGRAANIPVVGVIPGLGFTRFSPLMFGPDKTPSLRSLPWSARLQYPAVRGLFREHRQMLPHASALVAVSEFVQAAIRETFGPEAVVIRTPVDLNRVRAVKNEPRFLTMINPRTPLKGADILIELAEQLPGEEFQVAGTFARDDIAERVACLDNVEALGWVKDVRDVYSRTEILLVPSRYEEGGPRVIVEAFANGVPVVGTDRGGIPEFVDGAGAIVSDPNDVDEWRKRIQETRADMEALSASARERGLNFEAKQQVDRFESLLEAVVKDVAE